MPSEPRNFWKRFLQLLSKLLWHMNQPTVPIYTPSNQDASTLSSSSSNNSSRKRSTKSPHKISPMDGGFAQLNQPSARQGTYSPWLLHLAAIEEE
ncbi:unnamed protein product [Rotaria magnacalcarata]|uniref:Uncharacterized protein n=1 Tax=Rotaria magnacalcarata TaxID=392030 RepID=A0A819FPN5_9BILA|nr:unnamed protein product [Rotaria magnacalcarata]CAF2054884.1 unnamed protein product [Rotaria magnacalcarata]CAF2080444.1 unnamed protein product [Rotaria magnacalcarata]CAF2229126.1 unnamed protein product [Rotaria magnacalcarata]CAF3770744.1 unnamed protein product [Rotaria magnacalcarata]